MPMPQYFGAAVFLLYGLSRGRSISSRDDVVAIATWSSLNSLP